MLPFFFTLKSAAKRLSSTFFPNNSLKKGTFLNLFSDKFEIDDVYDGKNNELLMKPIYNYTNIHASEINVVTLSSASISKDIAQDLLKSINETKIKTQ